MYKMIKLVKSLSKYYMRIIMNPMKKHSKDYRDRITKTVRSLSRDYKNKKIKESNTAISGPF